jgi:hypothetical protein
VILPNLRRLLGDAPDVRALELIAAQRFGTETDPAPFAQPPIIRAGLDAVLNAAATGRGDLVPASSVLARIAPRLLGPPVVMEQERTLRAETEFA